MFFYIPFLIFFVGFSAEHGEEERSFLQSSWVCRGEGESKEGVVWGILPVGCVFIVRCLESFE